MALRYNTISVSGRFAYESVSLLTLRPDNGMPPCDPSRKNQAGPDSLSQGDFHRLQPAPTRLYWLCRGANRHPGMRQDVNQMRVPTSRRQCNIDQANPISSVVSTAALKPRKAQFQVDGSCECAQSSWLADGNCAMLHQFAFGNEICDLPGNTRILLRRSHIESVPGFRFSVVRFRQY